MTLKSMGDLLRHHAERKPEDSVAVIYPDGSATWWELERRANRRARFFEAQGVGEGDWVTIVMPNSWRIFEFTFALWKLGAVPNVIAPHLAADELAAMVELANPKLIVADGNPVGGRPSVDFRASIDEFSDEAVPAKVSEYFKILGSGGSTGRPKLIVDHRRAEWDPEFAMLSMPKDGVVMAPGPLYHNAPFGSQHGGLFIGATVVGMAKFDAEETLRLIEQHRIEWISIVPTMMHRIWSLPAAVRARYDVSSLKHVWHSAAAIAPWLKAAWIEWLGPEAINEMYGGTEGLGSTMISGTEWLKKPGSVGRATAGCEIRIVRDDGTLAAPGDVGEVYFAPADASKRNYHYVGAESRRNDNGWESLGDLGWVDEEGYLFLADRRTDLIVRGGANIYPLEVESALDAHPDVVAAIVIGLPDDEFGSRVHAIVEVREGASIEPEQLLADLSTRLAPYKMPESLEWTRAPLRNDAGKARRTGLRAERIEWLREGRRFCDWERGRIRAAQGERA